MGEGSGEVSQSWSQSWAARVLEREVRDTQEETHGLRGGA